MIDVLILVAASTLVVLATIALVYFIIVCPILWVIEVKEKLIFIEASRDDWRERAGKWREKYENR